MLCHRAKRHNLRHGPSDGCSKVGNVIIRLNLGAIGGGNNVARQRGSRSLATAGGVGKET